MRHHTRARTVRVVAAALAGALACVPTGCGLFRGEGKGATTAANTGASVEPPARSRANAGELVDQAGQARAEGDREEAIRLLAAAIEKNPTLTVAHMQIGDLYLEDSNPEAALSHFDSVAKREPSNFDAHFKSGYALQLLNRLGEAVRSYLRALSIQPDDFQANQNLATAYLQLKEPAAALPYAERAVTIRATSGAARANLGSVLTSLERHEEAVREYRAAAELMDMTPQLLLNLSESLGKLGRFEEMAATLDQLVATKPGAAAYERLGFARFKLRQFPQAQEAFRQAVMLDQAHYPALNGLGVCLLNDYIASQKTNEDARRDGLNFLRQSLRINRAQPKILELVNRYD